MSAFKVLLETYIDGARQHVARQGAGPAPTRKSGKTRETFLWRRQNSIEHAKRVIEEGEFLLAAVEAERDVWIIVQLALELGKLHERWKVDELKRRTANSRKGAAKANHRIRPDAKKTKDRLVVEVARLERLGKSKRDIASLAAKKLNVTPKHVRRLLKEKRTSL